VARGRPPENSRILDEVLAWLNEPGEPAAAMVRARLRGWVPEYTGGPETN
jgi:hypothetical protein